MQCSPEEIEKKRLQALEKLAKKGLSPLKPNLQNDNNVAPQASIFRFKDHSQSFKHNTKPYDKPQQTLQFYGKDKVITGKFLLVSEERFVVELSGFSTSAIEIFKSVATRNYGKSNFVISIIINNYYRC